MLTRLNRLIALCDAAAAADDMPNHSRAEKAFLRRCADAGLVRIQGAGGDVGFRLEVKNADGDWRAFGEDDRPGSTDVLTVFEKLCRQGYVEHLGAGEFVLTGAGLARARKERERYFDWQPKTFKMPDDFSTAFALVLVEFGVVILMTRYIVRVFLEWLQ